MGCEHLTTEFGYPASEHRNRQSCRRTMNINHKNPDSPPGPEIHAFVLRVRPEIHHSQRPMIIDVDDVTGKTSWYFTSLDAAFEKIRELLEQHAMPWGKSDNTH